jgi:hypothetical protein
VVVGIIRDCTDSHHLPLLPFFPAFSDVPIPEQISVLELESKKTQNIFHTFHIYLLVSVGADVFFTRRLIV